MNSIKRRVLPIIITFVMIIALIPAVQVSAEPTVWTVQNNLNTGAGSLRQMVIDAAEGDVIVFDPSVTLITLASEINFAKYLTIRGNTDANGLPVTVIDINAAGTSSNRRAFKLDILLADERAGTLELENLIIKNGRHSSSSTGASSGAAVSTENTARNYRADMKAVNCHFLNNTVGSTSNPAYGNAIFANDVTLIDCLFEGNFNDRTNNNAGGAVFAKGDFTATNSRFIDNRVGLTSSSGTGNRNGGAVYAEGNVTVTGCYFSGNQVPIGTANADTGAVVNLPAGGGAISANTTTGTVFITDSVFEGNIAGSGGAIHTSKPATIVNTSFLSNESQTPSTTTTAPGGSAVYANNTPIDMINCTFVDNKNVAPSATASVGVIRTSLNSTVHTGIYQCTIAGNDTNSTNAVFVDTRATLRLYNNIIVGNGGNSPEETVQHNNPTTSFIVNNIVQDGSTNTYADVFGTNQPSDDGCLYPLYNGPASDIDAIDVGSVTSAPENLALLISKDQMGLDRGAKVYAGAVEVEGDTPPVFTHNKTTFLNADTLLPISTLSVNKVKVLKEVENNETGPQDYVLIIAMYTANKEYVKCVISQPKTIQVGSGDVLSEIIDCTNAPEGAYLITYLWNDVSRVKPMAPIIPLPAVQQ